MLQLPSRRGQARASRHLGITTATARPSLRRSVPRVVNGSLTGSEHHEDTGVACVRKKPSPLRPGDGFLSCRHEMGGAAGIEPGASTGNGSHRHRTSSRASRRGRATESGRLHVIAPASRQRQRRARHHRVSVEANRKAQERPASGQRPAIISASQRAAPRSVRPSGDSPTKRAVS
jgi:hypothetical protein